MTLQQPAWLAALLLIPFFVAGAVLTARLRRKQWAAFVSPRLRGRLLRRANPIPRWLAFSFLLLAVVFFAIALSRPQTLHGMETETTRGRNVMLAIDLSRSMLTSDLKPDRLTQAKTLAYELIEALPTDRIGVVSFAGEAMLSAPLTVDHAAVREVIDQLDIDTIPVGGSKISAAIELAIKTLKETGQKENALVLLTDGEETSGAMTALASDAKQAGIYIFTVAIGTEQGDFVPGNRRDRFNRFDRFERFDDGRHRDRANNPVRSRLETGGLKRLALETNGRFAVAASASDIPGMVRAAISDLDQFEIAGRERQIAVEYYQWFLFPGVLCLIISILAGTRWRGLGPASTAAAALLFLFAAAPARADVEREARAALEAGENERAQELFGKLADAAEDSGKGLRFRLAQGTAAARRGELGPARAAFSEALRSKDPAVRAAAHHGMGNTLFGYGWETLSGGTPYPDTTKPETSNGAGAFQRILDALLGLLGQKQDDKKAGEDPMAPFDEMIRGRLMEWLQSEVPDSGETAGFTRFQAVITDWVDAVKHYNSALELDDTLDDTRHNRELVVRHLKRLREILEELEQNAQQMQAIPQPGEGPGEGEPQEGEGEGDRNPNGRGGRGDQEGEGDEGDQENGNQGEDGEEEKRGPGDRPAEDRQGGADKSPKPGEAPEDAARRILRENADFERGAPRRGRIDYEQPEKDW